MFVRGLEFVLGACLLLSITLPAVTLSPPVNVTVATDGSGNYRTVIDAVVAAPNDSQVQFVIHIKEGIYKENVEVPKKKTNIVFIGDGAGKTIITGSRSNGSGFRTFETATVAVKGDGFMAQFITFENSALPKGGQAVALLSESNQSAFYRCVFLGYQDTLYAKKGWQFYRECDIHGSVDFIFGAALAVFQNCNLYARLPSQNIVFTAQSKDESLPHSGYSIQNCSITVSPELQPNKTQVKAYLGRPWKIYSTVIVMESWLDDIIYPSGWSQWTPTDPVDKLTYREYKNRGPGANTSQRVTWPSYKVISNPEEAKPYTVTEHIKGDTWLPSTGVPYYKGFAV